MTKYIVTVGKARVEVESVRALADLLVSMDKAQRPVPSATPKAVRKHKHHQWKKVCPECGYEARGLQGLGIHRSKIHGYKSPRTHLTASDTANGHVDLPF